MGRTVTGLEWADGKLIAVEVSGARVSRARVREAPDAGLGRQALDDLGVTTARIHLVAWDPEQIHRTELLPPMSAAERSQFLERELAREGAVARVIGSRILRRLEEGLRKDDVLVVAAPREWLDRLLAPLVAARCTPGLVATAPLALAMAAQALSPRPLDRPTIVCHWGLAGLTVVVVANGALRLARQIPHVTAPGLDPIERVITELERSGRHYAQISKGQRVEQLLIANAQPSMEALFSDLERLESRQGLPTVSLHEALRSRLPPGTETEAGLPAGAFLFAYGAALLSPRETPNLLPRTLVIARRSRRVQQVALAAGIVLLLALGVGVWEVRRDAPGLRRALGEALATRQSLQARLADAGDIEGERARVRRWVRLLKEDPLGAPPLADSFKELSRLAPDRLRLEELAMSKDERGWGLKLVGALKEGDLARAQVAFNDLYFGLRASPLVHDVTFSRGPAPPAGVMVIPSASGVVPAPPVVTRAERQLPFQLALRLKGTRSWNDSR